jgi:DNA-binding SARP family transcriptional activator
MRISLFGGPRIEHDGSDIEVGTRKAIALLAYLAVTRRPAGTTL